MANWYVVRGDQERGPFNDAQLKELAACGKLKPEHRVRRDGSTTLRMAKDLKGLFATTTAPATSKPPPILPVSTTQPPHIRANVPASQRPITIALSLIFFWPVGLFLLWKHPAWTSPQKWRWASLILLPASFFPVMAIAIPIIDPEGWKRVQQNVEQEREMAAKLVSEKKGEVLREQNADRIENERIQLLAITAAAVAARDENGAHTGPDEFTALMRAAANDLGMGLHDDTRYLMRIAPSSKKTAINGGIEALLIRYGNSEARTWAYFTKNRNTGHWQLFSAQFGDKEWNPITGIRDSQQ